MSHVHAAPAMRNTVGVNTGLKGPSTSRQFALGEVILDIKGVAWIYGQADAALSAGAVTVSATGVMSSGTGYVIDKDVASGEYYWARSAEGGIGPADDAVPVITLAANATNNVMNVTVTWKDGAGNTVAGIRSFRLYLSDASTGIGLTATTLSGTLASTTGAILSTLTTKKEFVVETAATGIFAGTLTDTAETATFYVVAVNPSDGRIRVSAISGTNWG